MKPWVKQFTAIEPVTAITKLESDINNYISSLNIPVRIASVATLSLADCTSVSVLVVFERDTDD